MSDLPQTVAVVRSALAVNQLRINPHHAKPSGAEHAVPALVSCSALRMTRAIHFNDQATRWSEEVHDIFTDDDLPPKLHTELSATKRLPQPFFRGRAVRAHLRGAGRRATVNEQTELNLSA